jgi:hypothetical protein
MLVARHLPPDASIPPFRSLPNGTGDAGQDRTRRHPHPRAIHQPRVCRGTLPLLVIFDNTDLAHPFRLEAVYQSGKRVA